MRTVVRLRDSCPREELHGVTAAGHDLSLRTAVCRSECDLNPEDYEGIPLPMSLFKVLKIVYIQRHINGGVCALVSCSVSP